MRERGIERRRNLRKGRSLSQYIALLLVKEAATVEVVGHTGWAAGEGRGIEWFGRVEK